MNEQADVFVEKIRGLEDRMEVDLIHKIVLCTLDIICETAMGVRVGVQGDEDHYYLRALERLKFVMVNDMTYDRLKFIMMYDMACDRLKFIMLYSTLMRSRFCVIDFCCGDFAASYKQISAFVFLGKTKFDYYLKALERLLCKLALLCNM